MQEKTFKQLLMSSNYYTLNKQIVKTLGIESAFLLTILIEASDGLADDEGWFYQTIETLEDLTGLSRHKQNKIIQDLIEASILIQENRGTPCRRFFKISFQEIENLVFKKTETSLLKIDNNKEHNINNINKELNHKEEKAPDDLKKIKEWFKKNEIDFSKKHEDKIIELLKNNSIDYLLNLFQEQINILKNKKDVKNIAAVFSAHLFKGTCEVNLQVIEQKELDQEKIKNEQRKEYKGNDKAMEVFKSLPTEQQLKIEDEIIEEFKNPALREIKKNTEVVFYLMISQKIKEKITELGLLSA